MNHPDAGESEIVCEASYGANESIHGVVADITVTSGGFSQRRLPFHHSGQGFHCLESAVIASIRNHRSLNRLG